MTVVLISPSGSVMAATTDNEGNYSFKVAPSEKTYRVIPSKDGYTFTPLDRALPGLFEDLKEIDFVGIKAVTTDYTDKHGSEINLIRVPAFD